MKKRMIVTIVCSALSILSTPSFAQQEIDPEEELAYTLGVQAFIYGTGPLTVAAVRQTSTSVDEPTNTGMAPLNEMGKTQILAGPQHRIVPTVNNDTLYSQSHIDLDISGPMIIEIPKTENRFYIVQLLDAYSDSITDLIKQNAGSDGAKFLLVKKGWQGVVPKGITEVIQSPTPLVWYIQRTGVAGENDMSKALDTHDGFINYPLTELGETHSPAALVTMTSGIPPMTRPEGLQWFSLIDQELRKNPLPESAAMVDQFKYIGIGGKQAFNPDNLSEAQKKGLLRAIESSQSIINYAGRRLGATNNGWSMMFEGGKYGNDYLSRASINLRAAGLNVPERALYPNRYSDSNGKQLSGKNKYRMTMPATPPADAFWSLTMYDAKDLFMVENEINRYSLSSNRVDELVYNEDGTLTMCIQNEKPTEKNCNWLPTPEDDFYLHLRLYEPTQSVLDNRYPLPNVFEI